jgi:hypothetical protein
MACEAPCDLGDVIVEDILLRPTRSSSVFFGEALRRNGVHEKVRLMSQSVRCLADLPLTYFEAPLIEGRKVRIEVAPRMVLVENMLPVCCDPTPAPEPARLALGAARCRRQAETDAAVSTIESLLGCKTLL